MIDDILEERQSDTCFITMKDNNASLYTRCFNMYLIFFTISTSYIQNSFTHLHSLSIINTLRTDKKTRHQQYYSFSDNSSTAV